MFTEQFYCFNANTVCRDVEYIMRFVVFEIEMYLCEAQKYFNIITIIKIIYSLVLYLTIENLIL